MWGARGVRRVCAGHMPCGGCAVYVLLLVVWCASTAVLSWDNDGTTAYPRYMQPTASFRAKDVRRADSSETSLPALRSRSNSRVSAVAELSAPSRRRESLYPSSRLSEPSWESGGEQAQMDDVDSPAPYHSEEPEEEEEAAARSDGRAVVGRLEQQMAADRPKSSRGESTARSRRVVPAPNVPACTHACMHTYHTYVHTYVHAYMHTCMHTYTHACMHTYIHIHTYTHTHTHSYIHTYIHTCTHTHTHTHTHTYTHRLACSTTACMPHTT